MIKQYKKYLIIQNVLLVWINRSGWFYILKLLHLYINKNCSKSFEILLLYLNKF